MLGTKNQGTLPILSEYPIFYGIVRVLNQSPESELISIDC